MNIQTTAYINIFNAFWNSSGFPLAITSFPQIKRNTPTAITAISAKSESLTQRRTLSKSQVPVSPELRAVAFVGIISS